MAAVRNGANSSSASSCSGEQEPNIQDIPSIIVDPVDAREVGMDADMTAELEELGKSLDANRAEGQETQENKIYRENLRTSGADKYKTLREVRKGNTKRRIDNFENM